MIWNEIFRYNKNGTLTRLKGVRHWGTKTGRENSNGYTQVGVDGVYFMAHRIIWEMHHGLIKPGMHIDHIDFNKANNRIENLRVVDMKENSARRRNVK